MTTIFVRTLIIYFLLLTSMRLMGKRQIGELEISDLITTLLISEIASLPIADSNLPLSHAVIPIVMLLTFEVTSSALLVKFPQIKKFISTQPTTLIKNGRLSQSQMKKVRLTVDELISAMRQNGVSSISEVEHAILEQNGKISIIQKPQFLPPTAKDLKVKAPPAYLSHIVIENGYVSTHGLSSAGLNKEGLSKILKKNHAEQKDVYLLTVGDDGAINIIMKEKK